MNVSRNYKLWKLGVPVDSKYLKIFKFVDSKILNLQIFNYYKYPDCVLYMNNEGLSILWFSVPTKCLYVRDSKFWRVLESNYSLSYDDIELLIRNIVEGVYKLEIHKIQKKNERHLDEAEKSYKTLKV